MPRGRFLSRDISLDEKVDSLSDDTARLLFTWMIPHLDCEGRIYGEPQVFKSIVVPRRQISAKKIEKYLNEFEQKGLIFRYSVNGNTYIVSKNFEKHQIGLQKNKEAQSRIPEPPPELLQSNARKTLTQVEVEVKDKDKDKVVEGNNTILEELLKLSGWGNSHLKEDGIWLREFMLEYPELTPSHIKACRDFHSSKTQHTVAYWKTRLRNWMKREKDYKREQDGKAGKHSGTKPIPRNNYTRPEDL